MSDRGGKIILIGSERTAFTYRIDGGMDERDKDEYESMDSGYVLGLNWPTIVSESIDLRHRMDYLRKRNLGFSFITVKDRTFLEGLTKIDPGLPRTLAYMVADFYRNGTARISDLLENVICKNPAGLENILENRQYEKMVSRFLKSLYDDENMAEDLLGNCFFDRVPADRFGCASIRGCKRSGYDTDLILQIVFKA